MQRKARSSQAGESRAGEPEPAGACTCADPWWVRQGYPAFEADATGWPRPGQVVRYFRQRKRRPDGKSWTQADLARALGITERAVRNMEEQDAGLESISRRRFLAETLAIPPVLLGLAELPAMSAAAGHAPASAAPAVISRRAFDVEAATQRLKAGWSLYHQNTLAPMLPQVQATLSDLYEAIPFARADKRALQRLAAQYHILMGCFLRDQQAFQEARAHLDKAITWASSLQDHQLLAVGLDRRVTLLMETGHLARALEDGERLRSLGQHLPAGLRQAVMVRTAVCEAQGVQASLLQLSPRQILRELDSYSPGSCGQQEDGNYLWFDQVAYIAGKATALLALGWPKEALSVLLERSQEGGKTTRRQSYTLLLTAQAHAMVGQYEISAVLAQEVVPTLRQIESRVNLARLRQLSRELAASPYGDAPEVARLRALLDGPRRGKPGPKAR